MQTWKWVCRVSYVQKNELSLQSKHLSLFDTIIYEWLIWAIRKYAIIIFAYFKDRDLKDILKIGIFKTP